MSGKGFVFSLCCTNNLVWHISKLTMALVLLCLTNKELKQLLNFSNSLCLEWGQFVLPKSTLLCFFGDEGVLIPGYVAGRYGTYPVGREDGGRLHHSSCLLYKGRKTQRPLILSCMQILTKMKTKIKYFLIRVSS